MTDRWDQQRARKKGERPVEVPKVELVQVWCRCAPTAWLVPVERRHADCPHCKTRRRSKPWPKTPYGTVVITVYEERTAAA